jgi:hypothetical protein
MDGMTNPGSGVPDAGTSEEPALTQRNTATVGGEQVLSAESAAGNGGGGSSTGGRSDTAPTYGPAGSTTDAEEEGAG